MQRLRFFNRQQIPRPQVILQSGGIFGVGREIVAYSLPHPPSAALKPANWPRWASENWLRRIWTDIGTAVWNLYLYSAPLMYFGGVEYGKFELSIRWRTSGFPCSNRWVKERSQGSLSAVLRAAAENCQSNRGKYRPEKRASTDLGTPTYVWRRQKHSRTRETLKTMAGWIILLPNLTN